MQLQIFTTGTSRSGSVKPISGPPITTICSCCGRKPACCSRKRTGVPSRVQKLPGDSTASPVTVTTRWISGSPSVMARLMATTVPTFCISTPISEERPPDGTSRPVRILVSCLAPPDGYLVGITRTKICFSPAVTSRSAAIASGLLSSMPISTCSGSRRCIRIRIPVRISPACSCIRRSSAVI